MIRVSTKNEQFNRACNNARRALPVIGLELPRQYGQRWRKSYGCKMDGPDDFPHVYYRFENDADYTWFMMKWS